MFALVLGAVMIPQTALVIPIFLLLSKVGLVNTPLAMILPSLVFPPGVFLMRVYADDALSNELIEAGRVDGAGEFHIFSSIAFRLLMPGFATVLILAFVSTWNNYFLPLVMLSSSDNFPVTVGLSQWYQLATAGSGGSVLFSVVMTGALVSIAACDRGLSADATLLAGRPRFGRRQGLAALPNNSETDSMAVIELESVRKSFGAINIIRGVDLKVEHGEFVVFVGPSGSGKSTLLRLVAGLEEATGGSILIDGRDVTAFGPAERKLAMVFQSYALYPHKTVRANMSFGLEVAKVPRNEIKEQVDKVAALLQLTNLLDRKPRELSGGQRQRVAIGRAIVREPVAFMFDEPLSNLDAALRIEMRLEIAKMRQRLGATMIYVTHDQTEAMTLADRIVVLDKGIIQQTGSPLELYERPANLFVAQFIGSPKMNVLPARAAGGLCQISRLLPPTLAFGLKISSFAGQERDISTARSMSWSGWDRTLLPISFWRMAV